MAEDDRPVFTFREYSHTGTIHVFDEVDSEGSLAAICQGEEIGPVTYPLDLDDVLQNRVCRACLNRVSREGRYRGRYS